MAPPCLCDPSSGNDVATQSADSCKTSSSLATTTTPIGSAGSSLATTTPIDSAGSSLATTTHIGSAGSSLATMPYDKEMAADGDSFDSADTHY